MNQCSYACRVQKRTTASMSQCSHAHNAAKHRTRETSHQEEGRKLRDIEHTIKRLIG